MISIKTAHTVFNKSKDRLFSKLDFDNLTPQQAAVFKRGIKVYGTFWGKMAACFGKAVRLVDANKHVWYVNKNSLRRFVKGIDHTGQLPNLDRLIKDLQDYENFLKAVQVDGLVLRDGPAKFKRDFKIAFAAIRQNPQAVEYIAPELLDSFEIQNCVLASNYSLSKDSPSFLKLNRPFVLRQFRQDSQRFNFISPQLLHDPEILKEALDQGYRLSNDSPLSLKQNRELALALVATDPAQFPFIGSELQVDPFVQQLMQHGKPFKLSPEAPDFLKTNRIFIERQLSIHPQRFDFVARELLLDRSLQAYATSKGYRLTEQSPEDLKRDLFFIKEQLGVKPTILELLAPEIIAQREIYQTAISHGYRLTSESSASVRSNKAFMLFQIGLNANNLNLAHPDLLNDPDIIKMARNYYLSEDSPEALKRNKPLFIDQIKRNVNVFNYAAPELLNDLELQELALENGYKLKANSSGILKKNKDFILLHLAYHTLFLPFVAPELANDPDFRRIIDARNGYFLTHDSPAILKRSMLVVKKLLAKNPQTVDFVAPELLEKIDVTQIARYRLSENSPGVVRRNMPLVLNQIALNADALNFVDPALLNDQNVLNCALQKGYVLSEVSPDLLKQNKNFVLLSLAIKKYGQIPPQWQNDPEINQLIRDKHLLSAGSPLALKRSKIFVLKQVEQNPQLLDFAAPELFDDKEIINAAVRKGYRLGNTAPDKLKADRSFLLTQLRRNPNAIDFASHLLLNDLEIIQTALEYGYRLNADSPPKLKENETLVVDQVTKDPVRFRFAAEKLKERSDIYHSAYPRQKKLKEAYDAYELVSLALTWAARSLPENPPEELKFDLAAYYILSQATLEHDCAGDSLKLSDRVIVYDQVLTLPEMEKLSKLTDEQLNENDRENLRRFKKVYLPGGKSIFLNLAPDALSSLNHFNNPLRLKKQLQGANLEDFTAEWVRASREGRLPVFNPPLYEINLEIKAIAKALKEQFDAVDPSLFFKPFLKIGFDLFVQKKIINEDNRYYYPLGKRMGTIAAWHLLTSAHRILQDNERKIVLWQGGLTLSILNNNYFTDAKMTTPFLAPQLTALSGKLASEQDIPLCTDEAFDFCKEFTLLKEHDKASLLALVEKRVLGLFENPSKDEKKSTEEFWQNNLFQKESFERLVKMAEKLEKVGALLYFRYMLKHYNEFLDEIEFDDAGKLKEVVLDERRSPLAHKEMVEKYFPEYKIDLPERFISPCFDRNREPVGNKTIDQLVEKLFYKEPNSEHAGSCCVAAVAQAIAGNYDRKTGQLLGSDLSLDQKWIAAVRKAASAYILDNPADFVDFVDTAKIESQSERIKAVKTFAKNVLSNGHYFSTAELKAISAIVGRPVFIIDRNMGPRVEPDGTIKMEKINHQLNADPIYLYRQHSHYDHLRPKRIGTTPIV